MSGDIPIIGGEKPASGKTVEVCRSFAYKLNLANHGGPTYESCDLFASRKMQCSTEDAAWVSQQIFEECVEEVRTCVAAIKAKIARKGKRSEAA